MNLHIRAHTHKHPKFSSTAQNRSVWNKSEIRNILSHSRRFNFVRRKNRSKRQCLGRKMRVWAINYSRKNFFIRIPEKPYGARTRKEWIKMHGTIHTDSTPQTMRRDGNIKKINCRWEQRDATHIHIFNRFFPLYNSQKWMNRFRISRVFK